MAARVFSFSIKPRDTELIEHFQVLSVQTGVSFSRYILNALKEHKEKLDGKVSS